MKNYKENYYYWKIMNNSFIMVVIYAYFRFTFLRINLN